MGGWHEKETVGSFAGEHTYLVGTAKCKTRHTIIDNIFYRS